MYEDKIADASYNIETQGEPKTNLDCWKHYLEFVCSPDIFILTSFYFMISTALQRRVWIRHGIKNCYCNQYGIFVGPAATGKGEVISPVKSLLQEQRFMGQLSAYTSEGVPDLDDEGQSPPSQESPEGIFALRQMQSQIDANALDDSIFPITCDSLTPRDLTNTVSKSTRYLKIKLPLPDGRFKTDFYSHASTASILEELKTFLRSGVEAKFIINFLHVAWDCKDFDHGTFANGKDRIRNCCHSIMAGCTPAHMKELFEDGILEQGLASRTIFVYGEDRRFTKFQEKVLDTQVTAIKKLRKHLWDLAHLFGPIEMTPEAFAWYKNWLETESADPKQWSNKSRRLIDYYGRKNMHLLKMAAAIHFSEKKYMRLDLEDLISAFNFLEIIEKDMHYALSFKNKNEKLDIKRAILIFLNQKKTSSMLEIEEEFESEAEPSDLKELVNQMATRKKVKLYPDGRITLP